MLEAGPRKRGLVALRPCGLGPCGLSRCPRGEKIPEKQLEWQFLMPFGYFLESFLSEAKFLWHQKEIGLWRVR